MQSRNQMNYKIDLHIKFNKLSNKCLAFNKSPFNFKTSFSSKNNVVWISYKVFTL